MGAVATARVVASRTAVDLVSWPCALPEVHEGASFLLGAAGLAGESPPTLEQVASIPCGACVKESDTHARPRSEPREESAL